MTARDRARDFARAHYPFNLMNEWGDYIRPGRERMSPRGAGLVFLALALLLAFVAKSL